MIAIVNPAAGGGRCGRRADEALARLRAEGVPIEEVVRTEGPGHAVELTRAAATAGARAFLAVGGDGTAHEIVNGLPLDRTGKDDARVVLGFLPLGTGNSFLRDFGRGDEAHAASALREGRRRAVDVVRLFHRGGELRSINLLCFGFPADVASVTNRRFKAFGPAGYLLGVLSCLFSLPRRAFPLEVDGCGTRDEGRCLFLSFSNSRFTGGSMCIAPQADPSSGRVELVRFGPIGRLGLLRNLPRIYSGTHVRPPWGSRRAVERVEFFLDGPVDVMVDGEVVRVHPERLDVVPGAIEVLA